MPSNSQLLEQLVKALKILPGIGEKSAQRMVFYLLRYKRIEGLALAEILKAALENISHCKRCRTFTETEYCHLCLDPRRDDSLLCIVESPADILAIERTHSYRGLYFNLMGHLSPIDGLGPKELGVTELTALINSDRKIKEVILATNSTVEGEATAHYIANLVQSISNNITITRIAHGIPFGGELEYIDANTIAQSLNKRESVQE